MQTDRFVLQLPFIDIADTALGSWKQDQLADSETSLTGIIINSRNQSHHALANRALIRARLRHWDLAIEDAENVSLRLLSHTPMFNLNHYKSIKVHPSVNGYIARSLALIGGGKKADGCRVYDLAFRHCHTIDVNHILLIKVCILRAVELGGSSATYPTQAVVLFMAGEHEDAVARVGDLIITVHSNSIYYVVQVRA